MLWRLCLSTCLYWNQCRQPKIHHGSPLFRPVTPVWLTKQERADIDAITTRETLFVSRDILGDVQSMAGVEATGKQAASPHRRTLRAQDLVQYGFDLLDIYLNTLRHVIPSILGQSYSVGGQFLFPVLRQIVRNLPRVVRKQHGRQWSGFGYPRFL